MLHESFGALNQPELIFLSILFGAVFGLVALILIETMRALGKALKRFEEHPYLVAAVGGVALIGLYSLAGTAMRAWDSRRSTPALAGTAKLFVLAFLFKIFATAITLETGGSGGIVTSLVLHRGRDRLRAGAPASSSGRRVRRFRFVAIVAAAANTPIAACVMGMELLPAPVGVYAALCSCTAFLIVGHRSVYASQKLGMSKAEDLELKLGGTVGAFTAAKMHLRQAGWERWVPFLNSAPRRETEP